MSLPLKGQKNVLSFTERRNHDRSCQLRPSMDNQGSKALSGNRRGIASASAEWKLGVLRQEVIDSVNLLDERRGILHVRRHLAASPLFKGIPNFRDTRMPCYGQKRKKSCLYIRRHQKFFILCIIIFEVKVFLLKNLKS